MVHLWNVFKFNTSAKSRDMCYLNKLEIKLDKESKDIQLYHFLSENEKKSELLGIWLKLLKLKEKIIII